MSHWGYMEGRLMKQGVIIRNRRTWISLGGGRVRKESVWSSQSSRVQLWVKTHSSEFGVLQSLREQGAIGVTVYGGG